jgi:uncharacterized protein YqeY
MPIKEKLNEELKTAMRSGDSQKRDALRMLLAAVKQAEVDNVDPAKRTGGMSDDEVIAVLTREAKRRREAIEGFEKGGASDRADKERSELALIETYLPQMMGRAEIETLARAAIAESGATTPAQQGAVMQRLMPQVKGKADGKLVSQVVRELLTAGKP